MKRYFLLTSVLALAACGGGSDGGSNVGDAVNGRIPGSPTEHLLASSLIGNTADNNEITNMASAVVVKNGSSWSSYARAANAPDTTSHAGYTIYKLDNVDFKLAGEDDATFNFEINDECRIVRAVANEQTIDRDTADTSIFKGKIFQFVKAGDDSEVITVMDNDLDNPVTQDTLDAALYKAVNVDKKLTQEEADAGSWNYLEQNWKFDTSGKDKGLTYSDFGYFTSTNLKKMKNVHFENGQLQGTNKETDHESVMVFAGGYDILPEATKPEKGAKYKGTAIGVITASITGTNQAAAKATYEHNWEDEGNHIYNQSETAKLVTKNAELEIDSNGKTILSMPFGSKGTATDVNDSSNVQWYDVEINDGVFTFETPTEKTITKRFSHDDDTGDNPKKELNYGYYGVNSPVEATGTVVYEQKHKLDDATTREFDFQAAYGMAKQPDNN